MNKYLFFLVIPLFLVQNQLFSQATCASAVPVTVGTQQCGSSQGQVGDFPNAGGTPANPCNSFYNDDEYWFSIVGDGINGVQVDLSSITETYAGVFILDDCPVNSPTCIGSDVNGNSTLDLSATTPILANGTTYYIVVSSWGTPDDTDFCLDVTLITPPPPPANDDCSGAVTAPVNADELCGSVVSGTTLDATQSMAGCTGTADDDVWFSFVATNTSHTFEVSNVVAVSGTSTNMVHEVFSGSCGTTVSLNCSDPNTSSAAGLTIGNTYFVRVYSSLATSRQTFDLCIGTPPPPPANDDCTGAITAPVNADELCGAVVSGTTLDALQSMPGCAGTANDDVWFSFVATNAAHTFEISNITAVSGTSVDMMHEVFSGSCGTLTSLKCSDPNSSSVSGLTVGTTYFVRVYSYFSSSRQTFDLCIGTPPGPPANDECAGALTAPVNPDLSCGSVVSGTTVSGTESLPGCTGTANDDVWFSFVATDTTHTLTVQNIVAVSGTSTDMAHEIFSGTCGALTSVGCSDPNSSTVNGLTIGDTYFVRVYSWSSTSSQTFDLCIGTEPPPPVNDDCAGAVSAPVNADLNCGSVVSGSTVSGTESLPGCTGNANDDVWFSFVATDIAHVFQVQNVAIVNGTSTDMGHEIFSGACGTLTSLGCSDPNTSTITGLTVGTTYFVRVHSWGSTSSQTFDLCIGTLPPPPANDSCAIAEMLPVQADSCATWTVGDNTSATDSSVPDPTCGAYGGGDLWYEVTVPASGEVTFDVQNVSWTSVAASLYSGTCGILTEEDCTEFGSGWPFIFTGLTPGTYYLRAWDYNNDQTGSFEICAFGTITSACSITEITAGTQTTCDVLTNEYTQEVTITYSTPPTTGTLDVNGQSFPIGTSPQTVVLTGLQSNGLAVTVSALFSDDTTCALDSAALFTAPASCYIPSDNCGAYSSSPAKDIDGRNDLDAIDTITVTGVPFPLTDLNVVVKIDHTWLEDLDIVLKSPGGAVIDLMLDQCGQNNDMDIEFDDEGGTLVCGQPTVGVFVPSGSLSDVDGEIFNGDWILCVVDDEKAADDGQLVKWCLIPEFCNLSATLTGTDVSCNGASDGTATATATNGVAPYTYAWADGQATATISGLAGGMAIVTVSDAAGCVLVDSILIEEAIALTLTTTASTLSCNGDTDAVATATVAGGTSPYTYLWSNSETSSTASGLGAGSYTVTATDANGCTVNGAVTITQPPLLMASATITAQVNCNGETDGSAMASATGGTSPYTYAWSTGQTSAAASGLAAGAYTVTVSDANGCSETAAVIVTEPDLLSATVSITDASCQGYSDGSASATATGGTSPYAYVWDAAAGAQTTATATGLSAGTYAVTILDVNNCSFTTSVILDEGSCDFCALATAGTIDICATILADPSHPLATLDCDSGGITNGSECAAGTDPLEASDDCNAAVTLEIDICDLIGNAPNSPLATQDCDNGGVDNQTECNNNTDPGLPSDDCQAAIAAGLDICVLINADPTHPLATQDCDSGGVDNYTECTNGGNPSTPIDDCEVAADAGMDICAIILTQPGTHPWTSLDCDEGGVPNYIECVNGTNPSDPIDDAGCPVDPCETAIKNNVDICAILLSDPNSPLASLDCDNGGVPNYIECANGGDPSEASDDCTIAETAGVDICAAIALDPAHPLASLDCDNGGVPNYIECANSGDPFEASDDCQVAEDGGVNICMLINYDPNHPLSDLDCDEGGVDNYTECISGEDPLDPADDCETVIDEDIDVCIIIVSNNGNHPLASLDCDNGGVDNAHECQHGTDPNDPSDDCEAVILCNLNVCAIIDGDPNHPLADQDCDGGGMSNWSECEIGSDPNDPADDCIAAMADSVNICAIINYDPTHPMATSDCDNGGIPNWIECANGEDPSDPADDCEAAMDVNADICTIIIVNPTSPIATLDCDGGGVDNQTECDNGGNPTDPADDCYSTIAEGEDICAVINGDPTHPMGAQDCDNGGVDNYTECENGGDPSDPADDCMVAKDASLDICALIGYDANHPMASLDCDNGGVDNYTECVDGAGDPNDPMDDCHSAVIAGLDLCVIIDQDPAHPWASLDCDNGGIPNLDECMNGGDPSDPIDDANCPPSLCEDASAGTIDICAEILLDSTSPLGTLDCDGGGVTNAEECAEGGDPLDASDDCMVAMAAGLDLCALINGDPTHPLAGMDCDGGGISNLDECSSGENPVMPSDDCQSAMDNAINICQIINYDPTNPMSTMDCDGGGIDNWTECKNGGDPADAVDDCAVIVAEGMDICVILTDDPSNPIGSADCDGDGVNNVTECTDETDPLDECDFVDGSITLPVTADQSDCVLPCPDLTPITTILPGNIAGVSSVGVAVEITELEGIDTDGSQIIVRMPADPRLTYVWDPTLTSVALTPVNNAVWTFLGCNPIVCTFQYNGPGLVIGGGATEAFGFEATYDPQATDGQTTVTASIVPFSGGECNILNDTDSERLVYFE